MHFWWLKSAGERGINWIMVLMCVIDRCQPEKWGESLSVSLSLSLWIVRALGEVSLLWRISTCMWCGDSVANASFLTCQLPAWAPIKHCNSFRPLMNTDCISMTINTPISHRDHLCHFQVFTFPSAAPFSLNSSCWFTKHFPYMYILNCNVLLTDPLKQIL